MACSSFSPRSFLTFLTLLSLTLTNAAVPARASDLVPSDDLTKGASIFVFRESRKKPQARIGKTTPRNTDSRRSRRERLNAQIAANRRKRAAVARARSAELARVRARERNAKLKLSNTLTARGEAMLEKGDIAGAVTNFREALKANPKNADASLGLGEALTATAIETAGDTYNEAAVPYLEEAIKLNPRNDVAYAKLGEIHDAHGRNPEALANFEKALEIDPEYTALYVPVGLAYMEANNTAKADIYLAKAETAGLDTSEAKFARVALLMGQNKNEEALAALDRMIRAEPQNGEAYYHQGVVYGRLDQPEKSIASYKEAVRVDPEMTAAWFDLGVVYYNKGDYASAERAYREVLKIDNANGQAHANLASVYRQQERYADANAEYKLAEANGIKTADLYSEWGFCLGKTEEWDKSIARLETAESVSPTAVDKTNVGWSYYNAAQADKAAKNETAAKEKLEKSRNASQEAVRQDPNLDAAYVNLGSAHNGLGEHQLAVEALNHALRLRGDWGIALNQLGIANRGLGNLAVAITNFNRVVALDAGSVIGLYNLGSAQHASGDKKGAKRTQDRLKKLDPALADRLGNVIAGRLIDAGANEIRKKVTIPRLPF